MRFRVTFGERRGVRNSALRHCGAGLLHCILVVACGLLLTPKPCFAANHPPVTGKDAKCSSCHADMVTGKSVHSQGEIACLICHAATPDGNTVTMSLTIPKQQLCFACHERTAMQQHWPDSKRDCLGCHDAHRSSRAMLLRRDVEINYSEAEAAPNGKSKRKSNASRPDPHSSESLYLLRTKGAPRYR